MALVKYAVRDYQDGVNEPAGSDIDPNNFGSCAGDLYYDDWKVQYFGSDGRTSDDHGCQRPKKPVRVRRRAYPHRRGVALPAARRTRGRPAHPETPRLQPALDRRTYDILTSTTLQTDTCTPLTGGEVSDNGNERTVTDPNATEGKKFYRVQVTKP